MPTNARDIRDVGSVPGVGGIPGGGHGNPLQYSCLENPMDRGAQQAIVNGATKSWTLSDKAYTHTHTHTHTHSSFCISVLLRHCQSHAQFPHMSRIFYMR